MPRNERNAALDGLRALAILLVILHNTAVFPSQRNWALPIDVLAHFGWVGVQLFFVLSGLLITQALLVSRGSAHYYRDFQLRRAARILPLYVLVLVFFLYVLPYCIQLPATTLASYRHQWSLWLFVDNWRPPITGIVSWFPHFWSLAVEVQFYLLWPLLIAWVPLRRLLATCSALVGVAIAARALMWWLGLPSEAIYINSLARMDALILGAMVAVLLHSPAALSWLQDRWRTLSLWVTGLLVAVALATRIYDTSDVLTIIPGYTLLGVALALLVLAASLPPRSRWAAQWQGALSHPAFARIARYSYAMYVLHMPLLILAKPWLTDVLAPLQSMRPLAFTLCLGLGSYLLAALSWHALEKHFLRLGQRPKPVADASLQLITHDDFGAISAQQWQQLWERCPEATVFQRRQWLLAWWTTYGSAAHRLHLIAVYEGTRLVGLAPLYRKPRRLLELGVPTLSLLGDGHSDYQVMLVQDGDTQITAALVSALAALVEAGCNLQLNEVRGSSALAAALAPRVSKGLTGLHIAGRTVCPRLPVRDNEAGVAAVLGKQSLRRHQKQLAALGTVLIDHFETLAQIAPLLPTLFSQHIARWQGTAHPSLFLQEANQRFYRQMVEQLAPTGAVLLTTVTVGKQLAAIHLGLRSRGDLLWYKPSFDPVLRHTGPGEVLLQALLLKAQALDADALDFTRGDEAFKRRFASQFDYNVNYEWMAAGWRQQLRQSLRLLRRRLKQIE